MPYINVKSNKSIPLDKEENIKRRIGEAVTIIGKSEGWLMVDFNENCHLYFKGSSESPIAYVEVKLFGSSSSDAYNNLTNTITNILNEELLIEPSNIYVSYFETSNWGYNGSNF